MDRRQPWPNPLDFWTLLYHKLVCGYYWRTFDGRSRCAKCRRVLP